MTGHIFIYGEVGKQVTLDSVLKEISSKATDYVVHIHSPGGDVFEGYAIHNALKNTGKEIEVRIEGTCASIAMSIASAASPGKLFANTKSNLMIHNPTFQNISGSSKDLRNAAGLLDQIKSQFLTEWQARTGLDQARLSQMYDTETWLTPEQALELGFIDGVKDVLKAVASANIKKYNHMKDKNTILAFAEDFIKKVKAAWTPVAVTLTLADGTQIQAPDEDWAGQPVTTVDGAPLPPGDYALEGGATFTIDENGNAVSSPTEVEAAAQQPEPENDMKLKEENDTLKARVAELESALQARNEAAAKLEGSLAKVEAKAKGLEDTLNVKVKALENELQKFKETTVGDTTPPAKAINQPVGNQPVVNDPMKQLFGKIIIDPRQ